MIYHGCRYFQRKKSGHYCFAVIPYDVRGAMGFAVGTIGDHMIHKVRRIAQSIGSLGALLSFYCLILSLKYAGRSWNIIWDIAASLYFSLTLILLAWAGGNTENTEFCNGFQIISPKVGDEFLKNDKIEVVLTKGISIIEEVNNIDLYNSTSGKFVKSLWKGTQSFGDDGKASVNVKLAVPKHTELPGEFILKSWGTTLEGPSCFTISGNFTIDPRLC
ncbi:11109_t:CDS:2 [Funneliformis mosseae]|uniref:11109_t:CDS:1 n=1 Tax=Funneliformis mosseae TaxID=27381 RepID=A0A9N8VY78_FUNMO|nr:11109_t:CDS:2 [Funneliformis mosseae]